MDNLKKLKKNGGGGGGGGAAFLGQSVEKPSQ